MRRRKPTDEYSKVGLNENGETEDMDYGSTTRALYQSVKNTVLEPFIPNGWNATIQVNSCGHLAHPDCLGKYSVLHSTVVPSKKGNFRNNSRKTDIKDTKTFPYLTF